jgi:hypothetical protein
MANRRIKDAQKLGNGYSFEIIRAKAVHGGVIKERRPPHPLDGKRTRAKPDRETKQRRKARTDIGANTNVVRLRRIREEMDETKGLLPSPHENKGWELRFGSSDQDQPRRRQSDSEHIKNEAVKDLTGQARQPRSGRSRRRPKRVSEQLEMF